MGLVSVIHGPNLNLLGRREVEIYGTESLDDIHRSLIGLASSLGHTLELFQSNSEGALIDRLQACLGRVDAVLLNAAGLSHTSVSLRDAVAALAPIPTIEVHLSVPGARESFRRRNLLQSVVVGRVEGFRGMSYLLALRAASELIARRGVGLRDQ